MCNNMSIASQRITNKPKTIPDERRRCFPWGPPQGYTMRNVKGGVGCCQKSREFSCQEKGQVQDASLLGYDLGSR